jgi:hypothetical protein
MTRATDRSPGTRSGFLRRTIGRAFRRPRAFARSPLPTGALAAAAAYITITAVVFRRLLANISTSLPNDPADPVLNTTILWWTGTTLPLTREWWNLPAFFPAEGVTAFSEHLLSLALVSWPVMALGGNAMLAYNVAFLTSFVFCGIAMYLLVRDLTGSTPAAALAGLAFAFAPYRAAQLAHIQVLSAYWMPVCLLGLHRYVRTGRFRWAMVAAVAWMMQGLACGYYIFHFSLLVALWVFWFIVLAGRWKALAGFAVAWAAAALPVVLILQRYREIHSRYDLGRQAGEIRAFAPDVQSLLSATDRLAFWGWLDFDPRPEAQLFPGITVPIALAIALWVSRTPRQERGTWIRRAHRLALVALGLVVGLVLARLAAGPIELTLGFRLSVTSLHKPVTIALVAILVAAGTTGTSVRWIRQQSLFGFYIVAAFFLWLFALGPEPTFAGERFLYRAPYWWLLHLPGFDSLRVPARLWMVVVVCLSVAAGVAWSWLTARARRLNHLILPAIGLGLLADGYPRVPVVPAPAGACARGVRTRDVLLQLPLDMGTGDNAAMYRALQLGIPTFNGASGYVAPHYHSLKYGLDARDHGSLMDLAALRPVVVLIDRTREGADLAERYVRDHRGAMFLDECAGQAAYRIPQAGPLSAAVPLGPRVALAGLAADRNNDAAPLGFDDDLETRWQSGPQLEPSALTAELSRSAAIRQVVLYLGPFAGDFPRHLTIETSEDGVRWQAGWSGPTHRLAFRAVLDRPGASPLAITLAGSPTARWVRLRQTGRDASYWSVAELAFYEAADDR